MPNLLDYNLNEVPELQLLSDGEYQLRIASAEVKESKKGSPMVMVTFLSTEEPNAESIREYYVLPMPDDDKRTENNKLRKLKHLAIAFQLPSLDVATWVGATGFAAVRIEAGQENAETGEAYPDKNRILRFLGVQA